MKNLLFKQKKSKTICSKYHIPFIINDNVAVALAVDSDGIHIGQDDQPVKRVRKIIGPHKIIGVSAHNLKRSSCRQGRWC